jgi:hypothetical protein
MTSIRSGVDAQSKGQVLSLAQGAWVAGHHNLLVTGATA